MAWINDVTRSVTQGMKGVATGVWAAVATPLVYTPLRPLTKQALKGGFWVTRGAQSFLEETRREWGAMVREARADLQSAAPPPKLTAKSEKLPEAGQTDGRATESVSEEAASQETEGASLTEVKGIGPDYERLLHAAGITTVRELAAFDPETLRDGLQDANDRHEIVGRVPSVRRLRGWIERAADWAE